MPEAGFTLIELIAVMGVLAILATVVILNIAGVARNGQSAGCQTDVATINSAMSAYYSANSDWGGNFIAGTYHNDQSHGNEYIATFGPLHPTFIHTLPTACDTMTIVDEGSGAKSVSGTPS